MTLAGFCGKTMLGVLDIKCLKPSRHVLVCGVPVSPYLHKYMDFDHSVNNRSQSFPNLVGKISNFYLSNAIT